MGIEGEAQGSCMWIDFLVWMNSIDNTHKNIPSLLCTSRLNCTAGFSLQKDSVLTKVHNSNHTQLENVTAFQPTSEAKEIDAAASSSLETKACSMCLANHKLLSAHQKIPFPTFESFESKQNERLFTTSGNTSGGRLPCVKQTPPTLRSPLLSYFCGSCQFCPLGL